MKDIYGDKLLQNYELVDRIRFDVLDYCAKNQTDLIFTYVYAGSDDNENVHQFIDIIEKNQGDVFFVELTASQEDLVSRVNNESRMRYKKLTDPSIMEKITQDMSIYSIPFVDSLKISTSNLSPEDSVSAIISNL